MKRLPPVLSLLTAVVVALGVLLPNTVARAQSVPWGTVLVHGADWAGPYSVGGDLNVYSNGDGNEDRDVPTGSAYECVELAQRWAAVRFGEQRMWPVGSAYQMWNAGPGLKIPFRQLPNGGARPPQFGDLLVFDRTWFSPNGHVAVVADTGPGFVDVVEQNWDDSNPTGRARLPIQGTFMPDRNGLPIIGWLRSSTELEGYWLLAGDGGIFPFGTAGGFGSTGNLRLNQPIVGMAGTLDGNGYWLVAGDGGIFPFGDAPGYGSTGGKHLNQPVLGMAATGDGQGYWLVARDGGIFPFGKAPGYGSTGGIRLNQPIVGMTVTPDGNGYWLVARDGGIFPFGDAGGYGSTGNISLNQPIVGMASTADGKGYWLVAADGGIFPFGDAQGFGSAGGLHLHAPIVSMATTSDANGYWLAGADGSIYNFGDADPIGNIGGMHLNAPVIGLAAAPAPLVTPISEAPGSPPPTASPTPSPSASSSPSAGGSPSPSPATGSPRPSPSPSH